VGFEVHLSAGRIPLTAPCAAGGAGNLFNPGKTQSYSTVGLHLKSSDALHALAGRVGAFGDFDSDQYTDVFWIHDEALEVCVCVGGCEDRRRADVQDADDARAAPYLGECAALGPQDRRL